MANRVVGNVYIIDSAQNTAISWGPHRKVASIAFYSTSTAGELRLTMGDTTNTVVHIRNNQGQPFTLPLYLGGVWFEPVTPLTVTAGTAFVYFL